MTEERKQRVEVMMGMPVEYFLSLVKIVVRCADHDRKAMVDATRTNESKEIIETRVAQHAKDAIEARSCALALIAQGCNAPVVENGKLDELVQKLTEQMGVGDDKAD